MEIELPPVATPPAEPWPGYAPQPGDAPRDCPICPRLVGFRNANIERHPGWWNAPVPAFGDPNAWLAITGLAPGLQGANRTGRPFTGDWAGLLLYATLEKFGFTRGTYEARSDDGLALEGAIIVNSVRCVPPQNKPEPSEIHACRPFLVERLKTLPNLKVIIALGQIAHQSTIKAVGGKLPKYPFGHNNLHRLPSGIVLIDSYHCSRYNTNTGRLTAGMFEAVFESALEHR
ncbi:MAG: uracil-DNA glycosylase [Alphaproteobacteria bacterium]|nr:MAG: uracil-DNA glycosylase [Alphaproteobacteria bacterium]